MKKLVFAIILLAAILTLSACSQRYSYLSSKSEITEIYLVHVSMKDGEIIQENLLKIADIPGFLADFESIPCYDWVGDPHPLYPNDDEADAIKLLYSDGAYELINYYGRATFTPEQPLNFYDGSCLFDENAFVAFVDKYLSGADNE